MSVTSLLLPVFVQVALTFGLMFWMASHRVRALRGGKVRPRDIALREPNWPPKVMQVANCFHNQLELPMLFYVLVALILVTRTNSDVFVILAWAFVVSRLIHAYIHTGSNRVDHRFYAMVAGTMILGAMWVVFAAIIIAAGA